MLSILVLLDSYSNLILLTLMITIFIFLISMYKITIKVYIKGNFTLLKSHFNNLLNLDYFNLIDKLSIKKYAFVNGLITLIAILLESILFILKTFVIEVSSYKMLFIIVYIISVSFLMLIYFVFIMYFLAKVNKDYQFSEQESEIYFKDLFLKYSNKNYINLKINTSLNLYDPNKFLNIIQKKFQIKIKKSKNYKQLLSIFKNYLYVNSMNLSRINFSLSNTLIIVGENKADFEDYKVALISNFLFYVKKYN
ncbi:hypothetical protein SGLAD_v1c03230 [Spiroplasma gladiatoris]|uniref:Uncharacterized protein n=1 Tax=Spiroplasma gladiatoris TaxID=2143 RepID=A0A4P7AH72_9MOLU|nr:hypothetical protein [Spiroplasma gladiatoris]QBQ07522.1 hypothetical protein SGLAD_v1c03230 [Spiroplasma gladiatoris]